jgi:hypothetical protein
MKKRRGHNAGCKIPHQSGCVDLLFRLMPEKSPGGI